MKTCNACGHEGGLADFEQFDMLCKPCRKEAGPRRPQKYRDRMESRDRFYVPKPKPKPKPTGRSAKPRDERAMVVR